MAIANSESSSQKSGTSAPRRWVPFWVALVIVAVLVTAAFALQSIAPQRDAAAIPVLERVNLGIEKTDHGVAMGGYVAPAGWFWVDAEAKKGVRSPDGSVEVFVELLSDAGDPHVWLRDASAPGAAFLPIEQTVTAQGYPRFTLIENPGVNQITERVLVCVREQDSSCASILITRSDTDEWQQSIEDLINSVELL